MEKNLALLKLGIKYLIRYGRRYGFLLAALIFGFAVVTFITSTKDGMYENVYYSAQSHYAGDIVAVGYNSQFNVTYHLESGEMKEIQNAAQFSGINPEYTVFRTLLGDKGVVYFNGNSVRQKHVIGCDWDNEEHLFSKMSFDSPRIQAVGDDGIILSAPVAKQLGAAMGDSVILEVDTKWWQKNTGHFIVKGIVQDTSIFGYYKVYVSRLSLNRLLLFDDNDCSTIGFFLGNSSASESGRRRLQEVLSEKMQTGPLVYNREEMDVEINKPWSGIKVFLYTMPVYLSEVSDLLDAMNIITYFLYVIMLLIIFVSAAATYRLILHERTKEIGIMRAIGFYGSDLRFVLWAEIITLWIISLFSGFLLASILSFIFSFFSFSWFPGFEIFLKDGKLSVLYMFSTIIVNIVLTFSVIAAAVVIPSLRVSGKNLQSLLSGEPL